MHVFQAVLYLLAVILLGLAALGIGPRTTLALLGAASGLLAFSLPVIAAS